jgi:hypothetical protein
LTYAVVSLKPMDAENVKENNITGG